MTITVTRLRDPAGKCHQPRVGAGVALPFVLSLVLMRSAPFRVTNLPPNTFLKAVSSCRAQRTAVRAVGCVPREKAQPGLAQQSAAPPGLCKKPPRHRVCPRLCHHLSASMSHPVSSSVCHPLSAPTVCSCSLRAPVLGLEELRMPGAVLARGGGRDLGDSLSKSYY